MIAVCPDKSVSAGALLGLVQNCDLMKTLIIPVLAKWPSSIDLEVMLHMQPQLFPEYEKLQFQSLRPTFLRSSSSILPRLIYSLCWPLGLYYKSK